MDVLKYLSIAISLAFRYAPTIKELIDVALSNEDLVAKLKDMSKPLSLVFEGIGALVFPKAAPELHSAAVVMAAFDPNVTKWVQASCNQLLDPSPNLTVDGLYGSKTLAAVEALQTKLGLKVDGWAGNLTQAAIGAALAAISQAQAQPPAVAAPAA